MNYNLIPLKVYYRAAFDTISSPAFPSADPRHPDVLSSSRVRQHFPETWLWLNEMTQY